MKRLLSRLNIDRYILLLIATVIVASIIPARGQWASVVGGLADVGIVALFFLHGARLSRQSVLDGIKAWRLHLAVAGMTFAVFPILGIGINALPWLEPDLAAGMLFLTLLPSTGQSSIAFTAIARGNVAAAVCSASFSNLAGIFLTPLLVAFLMTGQHGGFSAHSVTTIFAQLLLPFLAGHFLRPFIGEFVAKRKHLLGLVDRGSILLVVYTAFGAAVVDGLWQRVSLEDLITIFLLSSILLGIVLVLSRTIGRSLGFSEEDIITLQFCGSKKSLASGVPMAGVLFSAAQVGAIILPLMIFHQMQLMVCAALARRYGKRLDETVEDPLTAT